MFRLGYDGLAQGRVRVRSGGWSGEFQGQCERQGLMTLRRLGEGEGEGEGEGRCSRQGLMTLRRFSWTPE